ncbi:hypothetical protein KDK88_00370, partial [bacterium]|nr:hypothetical protein [bacterium]
FDRHGEPLAAFGRELEPRRRTDADKDRATPVINVRGERNADHWDICDTDPAIARIMIDPDDGLVWVLTPNGAFDQPDGVLQTWDVFTPEGEFLKRVAIPLGHRMREGTCHLVGDGMLVVVRGTGTAFNAEAETEEGAEEPEPLEVICFRITGRN